MNKFKLPFDKFQRYEPTAKILEILRRKRANKTHFPVFSILDVGGAYGSLSFFLPQDKIYVADLIKDPSQSCIIADGTRLPFKTSSFDFVVSHDTLEHIPDEKRRDFLVEMIRTSRIAAILTFPSAGFAEMGEELILKLQEKLKLDKSFLLEHKKFGLPQWETIKNWVNELKLPHLEIEDGNVYLWVMMMILSSLPSFLPEGEQLQEAIFSCFNRLVHPIGNFSPSYRKILLIAKENIDLEELKKKIFPAQFSSDKSYKPTFLKSLLTAVINSYQKYMENLEAFNLDISRKETLIAENRDYIEKLKIELDFKEEELKKLASKCIELEQELEKKDDEYKKLEQNFYALKDLNIMQVAELNRAREFVVAMEKELIDKGKEIKTLENFSFKLQEELEKKEDYIKKIETAFKQIEEEIEKKNSYIEELSARILKAEELIRKYEQSKFFKIGKGLGLIGDKERNDAG